LIGEKYSVSKSLKRIKIKPERLRKRQPDNRFANFQAVQVPILNRLAVAFFFDYLIIKPLVFFQNNVFPEQSGDKIPCRGVVGFGNRAGVLPDGDTFPIHGFTLCDFWDIIML